MSTTLPLFWNLSSNSKTDRVDASVKLIGALEQFQLKFTPIPQESASEEDEDKDENLGASNDGLDGLNAPDVAYSIRRLVRGLASPRESSRLGFAVALTELLSRLNTVSASQILSLVTQASHIHGSMKGQEERDMLFARLFGITALTRSGILFRSAPLATSSIPACTLQDFQDAIAMLLVLPAKKSFLREPSYWTIILTLRALNASDVEWKNDAWTWITEKLFVTDKLWSPEKVGVTLSMQNMEIPVDWKSLLGPTFKNGDILSSGSLSNLAKILRDAEFEGPDLGTTKTKGSVSWKPQLHFVWNLILDIYFPPTGTPPSKIKPKVSYPDFFRVAVDDNLLTPTSSDGRKLWGLELFRLSLVRVPVSELPRMFTPNFMRSWVNHLSKPDRYLHKAAKLVASSLPPVITANPSAGFPVLLQLLQTHGHFDRLTKTKTVESMLAAMDASGVHDYVLYLGELARKPSAKASDGGEDDPTAIRIWVADQFMALIRNGAIPRTDAWISDVLCFLLLHSLFGIRKKNEKRKNRWLHVLPDPPFSDEARDACRTRLLSCLAELTTQTTLLQLDNEKTVRSTGVASDGELWVSKVLRDIVALENDPKHVIRLGIDEEEAQQEAELRDRTLEVIDRLKTVKESRKEAGDGAELLLAATLLHRYLNDEGKNYQEVETCLDSVARLFPASPSSPDKKKRNRLSVQDEVLTDEADVAPIDVVVDTLIGYLEKSTAYLRAIANQVFGLLTGLVEKSTIDLILAQLERRDPIREEDEEIADIEDSVDETAPSEQDSSEPDTTGSEEDDDEDIEDDPEFRQKIEEALRINGIQAAKEGSDEESGSDASHEDIMDDDQMMQLDEHLAEIFRSRAKEKGRGDTGAQREATHFKNRVLDLVDLFLRKQPTSKIVPVVVFPLVQVIMGTGSDEKQLSDKVSALLRSRFGKAKELPTVVDLPQTRKALEELHAAARKAHSPDIRETISACSLYLTRILLSERIRDEQHVIDVYRASLTDFATRKASCLQPNFFQDFVRRQPHSAWQLRDEFVQLAEKAVNVYRMCQIFQLLHPLFGQLAGTEHSPTQIKDFMKTCRQGIYATISNACDNADSLSPSQVKELLKLCLLAVRQTKRVTEDQSDLQNIWDDANLVLLLEKLEASRFKATTSLHRLCRQLLAAIGSKPQTAIINEAGQTRLDNQKKRKAEETKETVDFKRARRKKSRKFKD